MERDCPCGHFLSLKENDSLKKIAQENGITLCELLENNPCLNPCYYVSGQVIIIPDNSPEKRGIYTVVKGELLCDILRKADLSACELISYNPKADIFNLSEGDRLIIPIKSVDEKNYTILGENETLLTLSKKLDKSQIELLKLNPNLRPSEFSAGRSVRISV